MQPPLDIDLRAFHEILLSDFRRFPKNHDVMPLGLFFLFTIPTLVSAGSGKREAADCQPLRVARLGGLSPGDPEGSHDLLMPCCTPILTFDTVSRGKKAPSCPLFSLAALLY